MTAHVAELSERLLRMTAALTAAGVPPAKADAAARRELGMTAPVAPEPARDDRVLEKEEQREVVKRFRVCGFNVYSTSQARAAKVTPGIPDLWLVHCEQPIALWWETKRQVGGQHSDAQLDFAAECVRCGVPYGSGDRYDAECWLIEHELAEYAGGVFEPRRATV